MPLFARDERPVATLSQVVNERMLLIVNTSSLRRETRLPFSTCDTLRRDSKTRRQQTRTSNFIKISTKSHHIHTTDTAMAQPDEMQIDAPEPVVLEQQSLENGRLMLNIWPFAFKH